MCFDFEVNTEDDSLHCICPRCHSRFIPKISDSENKSDNDFKDKNQMVKEEVKVSQPIVQTLEVSCKTNTNTSTSTSLSEKYTKNEISEDSSDKKCSDSNALQQEEKINETTCSECGTSVNPSAKICPNCGFLLKNKETEGKNNPLKFQKNKEILPTQIYDENEEINWLRIVGIVICIIGFIFTFVLCIIQFS
jgi:hypothetical protein